MGREIKRVPLDFDFPLDESYSDKMWDQHTTADCPAPDECECDYSDDPPEGPGWQLWQTVSDGPITPVFETPEKLIDHMSQPAPVHERIYDPGPYPQNPYGQGWRRETARAFVLGPGWIPSGALIGGQLLSMDELVAEFQRRNTNDA